MQKRKSTLLFLIIAIICLILSLIPATQGITIGKGGPLFRTLTMLFGVLVIVDIIVAFFKRKK